MDAARTLREARQRAGLSQRALARRSDAGARTIAAIESGQRQPTVPLLTRLLDACGQHLAVHDGPAPATAACSHLREHLRLSLTERWQSAAARTGSSGALHAALRRLNGDLVLEPEAAVPVWVPGTDRLTLPLLVDAHVVPTSRPAAAPDPALVVVRVRDVPLPRGLVRVRAAGPLDLHVLPPALLARQHCCRTWATALAAAASLLDDERGRDDAGRRPPPHRQPDEDEEARRLSHSLRYTGLPRPDARDSRSQRLGAPVSLPQWLEERGLPPLREARGPWGARW